MAFAAETKILTSTGWKLICDLSGRDKVLVRNFLGDAEFTQPFALRKSQYEGEILNFGNKDWGVSLTPDHKLVYNEPNKLGVSKPVLASEMQANHGEIFFRKFRYNQSGKTHEKILLDGRTIYISMEDWYTILAYTVLFAFIEKRKNGYIYYTTETDKLMKLCNIFDMIGIRWQKVERKTTKPTIFIKNESNLTSKVMRYVGARARRDMRIPDKAIYGASASLLRHFIDEIVRLAASPIKERPGQFILKMTNRNVTRNIEMMCLLGGYGFSSYDYGVRGVQMRILTDPIKHWKIREIKKDLYSGPVYSLDLFDGLVYVTDKSFPVWMSPK